MPQSPHGRTHSALMPVPAAYLGVILIWSTTPLAIKWSGEGAGFLFAVVGRMVLGALLCLLVLKLSGTPLPRHRKAWYTYLAAGVGIYGAMLSVYWGAQFIPSGVISVVFGLSPLVTALMAAYWLGERGFTPARILAMLLGLLGLMLVFGSGLSLAPAAAYGVGAVLVSVLLHSASAVWVKRLGADLPALSVTTGGLLVALPAYLLTWWLADVGWPDAIPARAGWAILYLGVVGSVVGFAMYFHVLRHLEASRVAFINLVTPVLALILGLALNGEVPDAAVWTGTVLILAGLSLHQWGGALSVGQPGSSEGERAGR